MSNTGANFKITGILLGQEARNPKTSQKKIAIIQQTMEPGMNVSHLARPHGIQPSLLFKWKKQYQEGSLAAGEDVVPGSELAAALKQVRELQRLQHREKIVVAESDMRWCSDSAATMRSESLNGQDEVLYWQDKYDASARRTQPVPSTLANASGTAPAAGCGVQ